MEPLIETQQMITALVCLGLEEARASSCLKTKRIYSGLGTAAGQKVKNKKCRHCSHETSGLSPVLPI